MHQPLPPDVLADVAWALHVAQDPEAGARATCADVLASKGFEIETLIGALRRAGVVVAVQAMPDDSLGEADRLISRQQIGELFGLRKSAVYDLTQRPDFPRPVVISSRCRRWPNREVLAFAERLRHADAPRRQPRRARPGQAQRSAARRGQCPRAG